MPKFKAERFCAKNSLNLGFDSMDLAEIFLGKFLQSKGLRELLSFHIQISHLQQGWNRFGPKRWESSPCPIHLYATQSGRIITTKNCFAIHPFFNISSPENLVKTEAVNCHEKLGFACTLPWEWHNEVCASRCLAPNGVDLCKSANYVV
jgi:hypothetical protein